MTTSSARKRAVPVVYHVAAAAFVTSCAWLATRRPDAYGAAMQEDRFVEWMTVFVFASSGVLMLMRAARERRLFDALVGLFCLFVAGEEMSWGQRLFGLTPPSYFLEHNTQQEMNVHNFADLFGSPKGPFMIVLAGYALLLPAAARIRPLQPLLARIGATPPPLPVIPWFAIAIALLAWYPFRFTGEWVELLAGSAFLVSSGASGIVIGALTPCALVFAFALEQYSARGARDPGLVACAASEAQALADALRAELALAGNMHKRVWTLVDEQRVPATLVRGALAGVPCESAGADRRGFAVDPWGTAYWVRARRGAGVSVYSFGPNRRRDDGGDDITSR
ncbi:MAG TPA: hypothetical protein VFO66_08490 [Gemmatimonadaceae bacterium]|nr:hypothetical protein [Gemmatimonadaceae bacterium]